MKIFFSPAYWNFNIGILCFLLLLCIAYLYAINFKPGKKSFYFFTGILLSFFCIASPLHFFGEHYLFSFHMTAHVIILLIAAPLMVAGLPANNKFEKIATRFSKIIYHKPFAAWLAGVGVMWLWHVPFIYRHLFSMNADMQHMQMNVLSYLHMFTLLIAGMVFSWLIICPYSRYRLAPLKAVLYLATACTSCSLLGLLITFAPAGTYTSSFSMQAPAVVNLVKNDWGISAAADQQIAGLIMWVPCCFIYLSASMYLLLKYFTTTNKNIYLTQTLPIK